MQASGDTAALIFEAVESMSESETNEKVVVTVAIKAASHGNGGVNELLSTFEAVTSAKRLVINVFRDEGAARFVSVYASIPQS